MRETLLCGKADRRPAGRDCHDGLQGRQAAVVLDLEDADSPGISVSSPFGPTLKPEMFGVPAEQFEPPPFRT